MFSTILLCAVASVGPFQMVAIIQPPLQYVQQCDNGICRMVPVQARQLVYTKSTLPVMPLVAINSFPREYAGSTFQMVSYTQPRHAALESKESLHSDRFTMMSHSCSLMGPYKYGLMDSHGMHSSMSRRPLLTIIRNLLGVERRKARKVKRQSRMESLRSTMTSRLFR